MNKFIDDEISHSSSSTSSDSLYCRHHLNEKERFDLSGHCGKLKQEYARLANITAGRVPASFFASKANVIEEILNMMQSTYVKRQKQLEKCIQECECFPDALASIIAGYVPL